MARGDYSQIEARVICWFSGAEWKLDAFGRYDAKTGPDLYRIGAAAIYRKPPPSITGEERQVGKVSELALGFQGGAGALQAMAKLYRCKIPLHPRLASGMVDRDVEPETGSDLWIVQQWRKANPEISDRDIGLWAQLEAAAIACMHGPTGQFHPVGPRGVGFIRNSRAMAMQLPSGRRLVYWSPRLAMRMMPWGTEKLAISYMATDTITKRWTRFDGYGGLFSQGLTQATAREIMADALVRMDAAGMRPLLTVHDEGVAELGRAQFPTPELAAAAVSRVMLEAPAWAAGLPIAADCSAGPRYAKA